MTTKSFSELPLFISPKALSALKANAIKNAHEGSHLRIGTKGGGCSGLTYILEIGMPTSDDVEYVSEDLKIAINPAHLLYIKDLLINYSDGLNARGFEFVNPNASKTCGCGTSFAV